MAKGRTAARNSKGTVHVVDDDASVRSALSRLLRSAGHAVRTFDAAEAYLSEASPEDPGCVLLDFRMPGMDGLTLQERMAEEGFGLPIVFLSAHGDVAVSVRAMKHGAIDFLEKPFHDQDLLDAVRRALVLDVAIRKLRSDGARTRLGLQRLTAREYEVLTHVIAGTMNKVIAQDLGVSEKTVKVHRGRVMKKMEASSLPDLVRMAEKAGIVAATPRSPGGDD